MRLFFIISTILWVPKVFGAEEIVVSESAFNSASSTLSTIGERFDLVGEGEDFYQSLNSLPFVQANINSFINSEDSIRFAGQSSSQLLVLEDGIPQKSSTGIGGARSYHFLDPFFFDEVHVSINGASSSKGAGAFSGAVDFKSSMKPGGKFLLSVGSFGQQKIGIKKVQGVRGGAWSVEALRNFKAGPSLKGTKPDGAMSANGIEDDMRELNIFRFKWKENAANSLGYTFQLNYFNDYQQFDQFLYDDDRPFSKESLVEGLIRHRLLLFNQAILSTDVKANINKRNVLVAMNENTKNLIYNSKNLFGRLSLEVYDFYNLDNLTIGLEGSKDYSLELSEVEKTNRTSFFHSSIYSSLIKKLDRRLFRASFRIDKMDESTMMNYSVGQDYIGTGYSLSVGLSQSNRAPSFYELYSLYGNESLDPENNLSFEVNYKKMLDKFTLGLTGFYQNQRNLILYDSSNSSYDNLNKNTFQGIALGLNTEISFVQVQLDVSFTDSLDNMALIELSPLKVRAQVRYPIDQNIKILLEQIFYGPKETFGGQEISSSIYSKVALQYRLKDNWRIDAHASVNTAQNVLSDRMLQLNLIGDI